MTDTTHTIQLTLKSGQHDGDGQRVAEAAARHLGLATGRVRSVRNSHTRPGSASISACGVPSATSRPASGSTSISYGSIKMQSPSWSGYGRSRAGRSP